MDCRQPRPADQKPESRSSNAVVFPEMIRIIGAATKKVETARADRRNKARRLRAFVLLLRYTGLRIQRRSWLLS
jgi:hypothetical protein